MDQIPTYEASIGPQSGTATAHEASILYPPLPDGCIRTLQILPNSPKDEIHCRMQTFSLSQRVEFVALSYAWGSAPAEHTIRLNGIRCRIRKNLWRFLSQARTKPLTTSNQLWIDALCINQGSLSERTRQVGLVPQIYQAAQKVLVWLGASYAGSDLALRELSRSPSYWKVKKNINSVWAHPLGAAIQSLCERSYWCRLWVFQELMLAPQVDVMCGSRVIPLANLKAFLVAAQASIPNARQRERPEFSAINTSDAFSIIQQTDARPNQESLWDLMVATQHLRCAEQKDKVFALLGVASVHHQNIYPDYTMPIRTLLNTVLRNQHQRVRPMNLHEVENQCRKLTEIMGVDENAIFGLGSHDGRTASLQDFDMAILPIRWRESQISLWWTITHGHSAIQDLLFEESVVPPTLLCEFAKAGNAAGIRLLLDTRRFDVNAQGEDGWNAIFLAVYHKHEAVVKVLIDSGLIDWSVRRKEETLLHLTAREGNAAISTLVMDAVPADVDVNARTTPGSTPLYMAANFRNAIVVKSLLAFGRTDVGLRRDDWTPLHIAANKGWDDIVQLMLDCHRFDINTKRGDGWTPLHLATHHGKIETIRVMLSQPGLDVTCRTSQGMTALHTAVDGGHIEIIKLLLAYPVDTSAKYSDGLTALHTAAARGYDNVVRLLLDTTQFDVNARNDTGWTPLHHAAMNGHAAIARTLLALDVTDHDPRSANGRTPLYIAAENGHTEVLKVLLSSGGVDVNVRSPNGHVPLHLAVIHRHEGAVRVLLDAPGIDINATSHLGGALHQAAHGGNAVLAMLLLSKPGIEVNALSKDLDSPLHHAVQRGRYAIVRLLLDAGNADINLKGRGGNTPLHVAARRNQETVVRTLLEFKQLDINARDDKQWTALHIATEHNHLDIVNLLLKDRRIDAKAKRDDGADAQWMAQYLKHWKIYELF